MNDNIEDNRLEHTKKCNKTGYDKDCLKCQRIDELMREDDKEDEEEIK